MDPRRFEPSLPRMAFKFYEDASLDEDWVEIARKEVDEPEGEEEIAA